MTVIKLCGMMEKKDIEAANRELPEYIGFIFWEKSHRNLTEEKAKQLKDLLDKRIKAVGVFVDAQVDFIIRLYDNGVIDLAQLHGNEDEAYIAKIKSAGIPVIKAYKVENKESLIRAERSSADYILLDAGKGEGQTFNWQLLKEFKREYFLAGGLDPKNVKQAIDLLKPYGVDVSSGIETNKKKDTSKMHQFVTNAREDMKDVK